MKKIIRLFCIFSLLIFAVSSCANIDELSDNNSIEGLTVLSYSPTTIELDNTVLVNDTIYIPVVFGKYNFPLRFYAKLNINQSINKVVGIDLSQEQCLESINDVIKFHVTAKNGLARTYYIKAREVPQDENNYISHNVEINSVTPSELMVAPQTKISTIGDTLTFFSVSGRYPITITPRFDIASSSVIRNFDNGNTALTFSSERTVHKLKVISKSGAERIWSICLRATPIVNGATPGINPATLAATNIEPRTFSATAPTGVSVSPFIDNATDIIKLEVRNSASPENADITFPVKVNMKFVSLPGIQLFNILPEQTIEFKSYKDQHDFYMLDAENGISRHWQVTLAKWNNSAADVTALNYTVTTIGRVATSWKLIGGYQYSDCIKMYPDESNNKYFPSSGEIQILMSDIKDEMLGTKFNKRWHLVLDISNIKLSFGATASTKTLEWKSNYEADPTWGEINSKPNDCWTHPQTFTVTAQDGTQKEWKVVLIDKNGKYVPSNLCELSSFTIDHIKPNYAKIESTKISQQTKSITIQLAEDQGCYPISIYPTYAVSPKASITPAQGEPIVFNSVQDVQHFAITAEDAASKQQWTIALLPPPREVQANVTEFKISSLSPSSFVVQQLSNDEQNGVIEVEMSKVGAFPLKMGYVMNLSSRATASIPLRETFTFNSYSDIKRFTVTAQNGNVKNWTIKLVYTPQMDNWQLDSWSDSNTPVFWGTANNYFIKGTSSTPGVSGSAANLRSGKAPIVNTFAAGSIFIGTFDIDNAASIGLKDPVKLTNFGVEFQSSAKVLGFEVDIAYHPGNGGNSDLGSATIQLINYDPATAGGRKYEFHGNVPLTTTPHPDNSATLAAKGYVVFGLQPGTAQNGTPIIVVEDNVWKRVFIPVDYKSEVAPKYTHLNICFSSSYLGDSFVTNSNAGAIGSTMRVDNVKLIYEK